MPRAGSQLLRATLSDQASISALLHMTRITGQPARKNKRIANNYPSWI